MLQRVAGAGGGVEHAFGVSPRYDDMHWHGLDFTREQFDSVIGMDVNAWREELALHGELFKLLSHRLPEEMHVTKARIESML
jgi:phosphoenolpyruvate carboxykinase (GTP)